jgi:putative transposase
VFQCRALTEHQVRAQVEVVAAMLEPKLPAVADMLRQARAAITACADLPEAHWLKVWRANPFERLGREVRRRTEAVGILPILLRCTAFMLGPDRGTRRMASQ